MAIDSIQSLQRQLNDVEKKVCTLWKSACEKRYRRLEIRACLTWQVFVTVTNIQQDAFIGKDKNLQMFVYLWLIVVDWSEPLFMHAKAKRKRSERGARFPAPTQPVKSSVLFWHPVLSRFPPRVQRSIRNSRKQGSFEQSKYFQLLIALFELGLIRPASFPTLSLEQNLV